MKRRHIHNFSRNGIFPHKTLQEAEKALLLLFFRHVDKVNQDQTGNPAQADLAGDFAGCLLVYAVQKRIFPSAELLSAVHINRGQRFGRFDHEESAGRQIHTFVECLFYVIFEIFFLCQRGKLILIPGQAAVVKIMALQIFSADLIRFSVVCHKF